MDSRRMIYLILAVIVAIPYIQPIGIPVPITKMTRDFYNGIESIPPGSAVVYSVDVVMGFWTELGPGTITVMQHLLNRPVKIIITGSNADFPAVWRLLLDTGNLDFHGKKYGEDYVVLGFYTGLETGAAALAKNLYLTKVDIFGTAIETIPMMKNYKSAADVKAVVTSSAGLEDEWYLRQWQGVYGTKVGLIAAAVKMNTATSFYVSGQFFGIVNSLRGGAEYELMMNRLGEGVKGTDMISMSHLWEVTVIVIANIVTFMEWRRRSGKTTTK